MHTRRTRRIFLRPGSHTYSSQYTEYTGFGAFPLNPLLCFFKLIPLPDTVYSGIPQHFLLEESMHAFSSKKDMQNILLGKLGGTEFK